MYQKKIFSHMQIKIIQSVKTKPRSRF